MQTKVFHQKDPRPIQELMRGSTLEAIVKKAHILDKIDRIVSRSLNSDMDQGCYVLNLKGDCLILASSNGAMATRIRYQEKNLLRVLNNTAELPFIHQIKCIVKLVD